MEKNPSKYIHKTKGFKQQEIIGNFEVIYDTSSLSGHLLNFYFNLKIDAFQSKINMSLGSFYFHINT